MAAQGIDTLGLNHDFSQNIGRLMSGFTFGVDSEHCPAFHERLTPAQMPLVRERSDAARQSC